MRTLAGESSQAPEVEKLFIEWRNDLPSQESQIIEEKEKCLRAEMCTSIMIAWSKRLNIKKVHYWLQRIENDPQLPPITLTAHTAIVEMYCQMREPAKAEAHVIGLEEAYQRKEVDSPPDIVMYNIVLKGWAAAANGKQAAAFFQHRINNPDIVSYNSVINAFCKEGNPDAAEEWAKLLVDLFCKDSNESIRPQPTTFGPILSAWRQSRDREAAVRAEKVLRWMLDLYKEKILLQKPDFRSYNTIVDCWNYHGGKYAGERAHKFLSSTEFRDDKKLQEKIRRIRLQRRTLKLGSDDKVVKSAKASDGGWPQLI
jgi:pentatricopeptide repeat protein